MALTKVGGGIIQQPIDVGIITATSVNASGVITATSFDGNVTGDVTGNVTGNLTGDVTGNTSGTAGGLTGTPNITVGSVTATTGNFSGNLAVGGVLTYEDVTNVDSVGIITARDGINVTGHSELDNINVTGVSTGTKFNSTTSPNYVISDGTTEKGYIGYNANDPFIGRKNGVGLAFQNNKVRPVDGDNGSPSSNTVDLGEPTYKFKDAYLTGTVNSAGINVTGVATATTFSGNLTGDLVGSPDLSAIDSTISDTAVDVFIYDTSKDSDGGAWRKRTQHTSWYNETLNTATRGSRREFPAVAVIVSDVSSDKVTIYDGDDPDLPMWMVISGANPRGILGWATGNITRINVTALNGILVAATNDGGTIFKFIEDFVEIMYNSANYNITSSRTIADRNDTPSYDIVGGTAYRVYVIGWYAINDVSMTVLPNAPIDDRTGLPVPTIAVAQDRGISIIMDDGKVISSTSNSSYDIYEISILPSGELYHRQGSGSNEGVCFNYPYTRIKGINLGTYANSSTFWYGTDDIGNSSSYLGFNTVAPNAIITPDYKSLNIGDNRGLTFVDVNKESLNHGMSAFTASNYSTGWMHGDVKGAFLSDTDTTNVTASSAHYTETFTGSGDNTWGLAGGATMSGGVLTLANLNDSRATDLTAASSLTTGQKYIAEIEIASNTSQVFKLDDDGAGAGIGGNTNYGFCGSGQTGTFLIGFTKTASPRMRLIRVSGGPATITSFKIYTAEEQDRSVNNNGLKVFGTITKSAVATGADLVAYSGFSNSNVLVQPYNSNLDPGTGDYSFMLWFKCSSTGSEQILMRRFSSSSVTGGMMMRILSSSSVLQWYVRDTSSNATAMNSTMALDDGIWHCVVGTRQGGNAKLYIDGELNRNSTCSASSHNPGNDANLAIGAEEIVGSPGTFQNPADLCSLALVRYSLSVPSPEQVKKMYEDEKVLFQENAKATLYGSSDAVTALAYDDDTDLLHVGTSSGRSDFQGLRRINNTTTAVTTAITAQNEFIIEQ